MAEKSAVVEIAPEEQIELCSAPGSGLANAATLVSAQMPVMTEVLETGEFQSLPLAICEWDTHGTLSFVQGV